MLYMPGRCNGRVSRCCHIESGFTDFLCACSMTFVEFNIAQSDLNMVLGLKITKAIAVCALCISLPAPEYCLLFLSFTMYIVV